MPVDSTYVFVAPCETEPFGEHFYDVYSDGTHANTCQCGKSVVLPHDTKLALKISYSTSRKEGRS